MKDFRVSVDVTMGVNVYVKAENEEDAQNIAKNYIGDDPMYYVRNGWLVNNEVVEVEEMEEEDDAEEEDDEDDLKIWRGGYDEDELKEVGLDIMTFPESQLLMDKPGFYQNAWLINDEEGLDTYGGSAYVYNVKWFEKNS